MRHLVTGGCGFLGNLIAKRLLIKNENVRIIDVWKDPSLPKEIEFIEGDVCDRRIVAQAMEDIDIVHHNAAFVPLTKSKIKFNDVNIHGSKIVAEEALKANIKAFIHMSSSAIFGKAKSPISNITPPCPVEIYGKSKLLGEQAVQEVLANSDTALITIRPRTILGEGRLGIFQILFDWIRKGKNVYVIGNGNIPFQFIHAHDLMDAYMLILERGERGTYNVGTDEFGTLRNTLENLITYAKSSSKVVSLPEKFTINSLRILDYLNLSPLAPWHYLTYHKEFHFDITPLQKIGWAPKYSNDQMFQESYDSFLKEKVSQIATESCSVHRKPVKERLLWIFNLFS